MKRIATYLTPLALVGLMTPALAAQQGDEQGQKGQSQQQGQMQDNKQSQQAQDQRGQGQQQQAQGGQPKGRQQMSKGRNMVIGELVDTRDVSLKGKAGNQHKLLKVNAEGDTVIVDLGQVKAKNFEALNLSKGDRLWVAGNNARINGKPVIYARYLGQVLPYVPQIFEVTRQGQG